VVDEARMRASLFLELGRVQGFHLQRWAHSRENFGRALDLWERLGILEMKAATLQEIAVVEDLCGNQDASNTCRRRLPFRSSSGTTGENSVAGICCMEFFGDRAAPRERTTPASAR
jgi:hypothetical protein